MFREAKTHEIIDFLNSLFRSNRILEFEYLYTDALEELSKRSKLLHSLYTYYKDFNDGI